MSEHIDSVNNIIAILTDAKRTYEDRDDNRRAIEFARHIQELSAFRRDYERLEELMRPIPVHGDEDLSDLPQELLSEISAARTDDLENQIFTVLNAADGTADIDTILIYLFRKFKVIQTRKYLQNKLWRMTQKGLIRSIEGKKGVYTTLIEIDEKPNESLSSFDHDDLPSADDDLPF